MAWFKVDDTFPLHPKVITAGNAATGLWVRAGAWAMQQLTDGWVPDDIVRMLGRPAEAKRLVSAGLWVRGEGGYQFHDWTDTQRTREQVKVDRDAATERQRKAREAAKSRRESQQASRRDSQRSNAVSHGPPDQTRPDQTSSSYGTTPGVADSADPTASAETEPGEPPAEPAKPQGNRKKPAKPLPDDWQPTDEHLTRCRDLGVDPGHELAKFRAHADANDRRQVNWNSSFTQWLLNARPNANGVTASEVHRLPHVSELEEPPDGLTDAEYEAWMRRRQA